MRTAKSVERRAARGYPGRTSNPKGRPLTRPPRSADETTYPGRVSAKLRALREQRGWSVEQLQAALALHDAAIEIHTLYAYERGKARGGVDLPLRYIPAVAKAFGFKTANGWLPAE